MAATGELVLPIAAAEVHRPLKTPMNMGAHQVGLSLEELHLCPPHQHGFLDCSDVPRTP